MLKHLLATGIILAVLICTATVALEAVGLLHFGRRDPAQGTDALFAPIVEEDPGEVPSEIEPDLPQLVVDGERKGADVQDRGGHEEQAGGHEGERPEDEQPAGALEGQSSTHASPKAASLRPEVEREPPPRPVQEPRAYAAGLIAAAGVRPGCGEPCAPKVLPKSQSSEPERPPSRLAKPKRGKPVPSPPRGYRSLGWPVLDWLDAALASGSGPGRAGRSADL